ncbi:MAG: hypothetical protein A2Y33_02535 [Spirochaetes bacterium GWF1_51_8]|nr:MAG: hypothetical protein A2Y33_02535 [Spirochaetes bacterium GWF1_51_8]
MIKTMINNFLQDFTNSIRDNMLLYILVAPVILAVLFRVFTPSAETVEFHIAIDASVEQHVADEFRGYMVVELFDTPHAVKERVNRYDDTAGIILENGKYRLYFQGNEDAEVKAVYAVVMDKVLYGKNTAEVNFEQAGSARSYFLEYSLVTLLMVAGLLGGLLCGFNIVDERSTGSIGALAVSPLTIGGYMASKLVFTLLISAAAAILTATIVYGFGTDFGRLVLAMAVSSPLAAVLGFILGITAKNQIEAIGMNKILLPVFMTIPIVSIFIASDWQWVFYIFPNYWMFVMFENLFLDTPLPLGFWGSALITLLSGTALFILMRGLMKKRLNLR